LEKQLVASQSRHSDFEDAILQVEREKSALDRQLEAVRKQLDGETAKRSQLEAAISTQKKELVSVKDRNVKLDRDLNKALKDIKDLEWANRQLESKQDKTIVEHVHVLEKAKKVTDKQLEDAKLELEKQVAYIRSLEKAKSRLIGESEDLTREADRERREIQRREKELRVQQERAARATTELEKERHVREAAELHNRKLQNDFQSMRAFSDELQDQLNIAQRSKANLETELARLADETQGPSSLARVQRQYESRISQLENELHDAHLASATAARIKERIDAQHAEIRRLIMNDGPKDDAFRTRLLRELQLADEQLNQELGSRVRSDDTGVRTLGNVSPTKRTEANGARPRTPSIPASTPAADKQANALRQKLQILEIQMATSDRVRQHLEVSLRDMAADLDSTDGSKQNLERTRARLSKENARLAELLEEEAETRRVAEAAQKDGVQFLWQKFKNTMATEQESYSRLEESRKALVCPYEN
jgi:myosin heavy chain 9/10/11/14